MLIGDVEIPIVSDIINLSEAEVEEIKPLKSYGDDIPNVPVKHEASVQSITILGFLNPETHSEHLSLGEQKEAVKSLRDKGKLDNTFTYGQYKGHLLIEDVDFLDDSDSRIVNEVEIVARYFPWPMYYPESEP